LRCYRGAFQFAQHPDDGLAVRRRTTGNFGDDEQMTNHQVCLKQPHQMLIALFEMSYPNRTVNEHIHGWVTSSRRRGTSSMSGICPPSATNRRADCRCMKAFTHSLSSSDFSIPGSASDTALAYKSSSMGKCCAHRRLRASFKSSFCIKIGILLSSRCFDHACLTLKSG
jgi:hypothetical protein